MSWETLAHSYAPHQRGLRALADVLPANAEPALRAALEARNGRVFTNIWLASLSRGDLWDASTWLSVGAALLPNAAVLTTVCGALEGDVPGALLAAVHTRKLGWDLGGVALLLAAVIARKTHQPDPDGLWRQARKLARKQPGGLAQRALHALTTLTDDPGLEDALGDIDAPNALRADLETLLERPVLSSVPALPSADVDGPVARAAHKVGRNDLCPCGSEQKYKNCHEATDLARRSDPSPVAGVTGAELEDNPHLGLTIDRLLVLRPHTLARLQATRLTASWVPLFLDRLLFFREVDALHRAYATLDDPALDEVLDEHIAAATWDGDLALAHQLVRHHHGTPNLPPWVLGVLVSTPLEHIDLAEELAREDLDGLPIAAAYTLLHSPWPALGVLVARAILPFVDNEQAEPLLTELLEARDHLGLSPWDPVDDVLYHLRHGHSVETDQDLEELSTALAQEQSALRAAHWQLQQLQSEAASTAEHIPQTHSPTAPPAADPILLDRIRTLKSELKERHAERNALRRALATERSQARETPGVSETQPSTPDTESPVSDGRLRIPVFGDLFRDAMVQVPQAVARSAVEKAAQIAAGRAGAFIETRRLRGQHGLWRAKVGRSYRMLFRLTDNTVDVLDLVHRQDLDKRLRQLGGA